MKSNKSPCDKSAFCQNVFSIYVRAFGGRPSFHFILIHWKLCIGTNIFWIVWYIVHYSFIPSSRLQSILNSNKFSWKKRVDDAITQRSTRYHMYIELLKMCEMPIKNTFDYTVNGSFTSNNSTSSIQIKNTFVIWIYGIFRMHKYWYWLVYSFTLRLTLKICAG